MCKKSACKLASRRHACSSFQSCLAAFCCHRMLHFYFASSRFQNPNNHQQLLSPIFIIFFVTTKRIHHSQTFFPVLCPSEFAILFDDILRITYAMFLAIGEDCFINLAIFPLSCIAHAVKTTFSY